MMIDRKDLNVLAVYCILEIFLKIGLLKRKNLCYNVVGDSI